MKSIIDTIYEHQDQLGHELVKGDFIMFKPRTTPCKLYGQIQDITNDNKPKYKVRVLGWFGDESLKSKIKKDFYDIDVESKSILQLTMKNQVLVDKLKKDNIII